jgi:hypothetical protein
MTNDRPTKKTPSRRSKVSSSTESKKSRPGKVPEKKDKAWSHWLGPKERRMLIDTFPGSVSAMPLFKSAKFATLPKGLEESTTAESLYLALRKGNNFFDEQFWKGVATLIAVHGKESGVKPEILWKYDSRALDWNGSEFVTGIDDNGKPSYAAMILTKKWLYLVVAGGLVLVFNSNSLPSLPTFAPGMLAGKLILPYGILRKGLSTMETLAATGGIGIDRVPILKANELFALLKKYGWGSWD